MKRREFIAVLGGALSAWPLWAKAQQSVKVRRIGVLFALAESDPQARARLATFRRELEKLGWPDITIDARYNESNNIETHQRYAKELVALKPEVLIAQNTDSTNALQQQTRTIPIIFTIVGDPVNSGFVASFSKPGGNVTGFTSSEPTLGGKWLELLKEVAPSVSRVLVPFNTATSSAEYYLGTLKATAVLSGIDAGAAFVGDEHELDSVIAAHARLPLGGLVVIPDAFMTGHLVELISIAARYNLPTIYPYRFYTESGGLFSYGTDLLDNFRRAAGYADRILKGAKVGDLPVQAPEKFELVINLKTANMLNVTFPSSLLGRADMVIE